MLHPRTEPGQFLVLEAPQALTPRARAAARPGPAADVTDEADDVSWWLWLSDGLAGSHPRRRSRCASFRSRCWLSGLLSCSRAWRVSRCPCGLCRNVRMRSTMVAMLVSFLSWIFVPAAGRSPESGEGGDGCAANRRPTLTRVAASLIAVITVPIHAPRIGAGSASRSESWQPGCPVGLPHVPGRLFARLIQAALSWVEGAWLVGPAAAGGGAVVAGSAGAFRVRLTDMTSPWGRAGVAGTSGVGCRRFRDISIVRLFGLARLVLLGVVAFPHWRPR